MGMESVFRLSVILGLVNNLSGPMSQAASSTNGVINNMQKGFGSIANFGAGVTALGVGITSAALGTVKSTFETKNALAELKSLGVKDLKAVEDAAKSFSDTWAGTSKSDFISASYDIKSGISTLSDEGVAQYTEMAGLTAKATKATTAEMTSLFATGYGIYKDYYGSLSDMEFGEMFSAGISESVRAYKTSGSQMAASISTLGATATTANVPLEEQLSIMGMLQATMSGSEAGTKYKAFVNAAVQAGDKLKLKFTDSNNQLLSMPEILAKLKGKYGDTIDAMEKKQIKEAFGTDEAVAVIDLLYGKTDTLQSNILSMYDKMGQGRDVAQGMAEAINSTESQKYEVLKQQIHNVSEELGQSLLPTVNQYLGKAKTMISNASDWIQNNQKLVSTFMNFILILGIVLTVVGGTITAFGYLGGKITALFGAVGKLWTGLKKIPNAIRAVKSGFETMRIYGMLATDKISAGFGKLRSAGNTAITAVKNISSSVLSFAKNAVISGVTAAKNFVISLASMAKQAIITAVTALPGLIAGVWSFTAALLANPITWIVVGVVALIAALILLWKNWDKVSNFIQSVWTACVTTVGAKFQNLKTKFITIMNGIKNGIKTGITAIVNFFKQLPGKIVAGIHSLPAKVKKVFSNMLNGAKNIIKGAFVWFRNSGSKIMSTFTEGIKSAISKPVNAVKGGLSKIRKMLPFSDAKEGPLSTLTLSGRRVFETINTGMQKTSELPAKTTKKSLSKVKTEIGSSLADSMNKKKVKKLKERQEYEGYSKNRLNRSESNGSSMIIQNLKIEPNMKDMKDFPLLMGLIEELKDSKNQKNEPEPMPV